MKINRTTLSFKQSIIVQAASKYVSVAVNMAMTMILARLLTPEQYGEMSIVTVFLGLFTVISNAGINAAVIQYRDLTNDDLRGLLSFTLMMGVSMAILFCLISVPVSVIYGSWSYVPMMCYASLSVGFRSVDMVPDGIQIRDRQFVLNGIRAVVSSFVAGIVAVLLAIKGCGVYSLVTNNVLQALIVMLWNLKASGLYPGRVSKNDSMRRVMKFSIYQLVSQVVQYLVRNLDNLLVGAAMGPSALGFYDKAYKLSKYPIDYIPSTINPVLKSWFSALQGDREELYSSFLRVQTKLAAMGFGIGTICMFCGRELVLIMFGEQWGGAISSFQLLAFSIPFQLVNFTAFSALEGLRRTDLLLRNVLLNCAITIALLFVGISLGSIESVAALVSVGFVLATPSFLWCVVRKGFGKSSVRYLMQLAPAFSSALLTSLILSVAIRFTPSNLFLSLGFKVTMGGGSYLLLYTIAKYLLAKGNIISNKYN